MAGGDAPVPAAHVSARENRAGAKPGGDAPVPAAQACGHMTPCACHCAACRAAGHGTGMCLHLCARLLALTEGNQDVVDLILRRYRGCGLCNGRAVCLKEDPVRSLCYDPRGDVLAAGDGGGRIHTLCAQTGQSLSTVSTGNADWVMCLQWNHAGSKLASGSDDKTVKIWSARGEDDILECQSTFRGRHACCTASAAARPFSSSATQLQSKSQVSRRRLDVGEHRNNVQALHAGAYIYSENSTIIKLHKTETLNVYAPSLFASYARNLCSVASEHHSLHAPIFVLPL